MPKFAFGSVADTFRIVTPTASGSGNGTSEGSAWTLAQAMASTTAANLNIWIKAGTYTIASATTLVDANERYWHAYNVEPGDHDYSGAPIVTIQPAGGIAANAIMLTLAAAGNAMVFSGIRFGLDNSTCRPLASGAGRVFYGCRLGSANTSSMPLAARFVRCSSNIKAIQIGSATLSHFGGDSATVSTGDVDRSIINNKIASTSLVTSSILRGVESGSAISNSIIINDSVLSPSLPNIEYTRCAVQGNTIPQYLPETSPQTDIETLVGNPFRGGFTNNDFRLSEVGRNSPICIQTMIDLQDTSLMSGAEMDSPEDLERMLADLNGYIRIARNVRIG